ncbi:diguanylate cyclase domain-containing protein [Gemmobacter denitrificans]|uniref:guanylate cyclase n=1 Tax=Gemmobacter denitrificans TaxID=3123040 RepID=A0ABU8BWE4_9RHOB
MKQPLTICLQPDVLGKLMPMHLAIDPVGQITTAGATLQKLFGDKSLIGQDMFALFDVRRPSGISDPAGLAARAGQRIYLVARDLPGPGFRGLAVPQSDGLGMLLNLSFGIGIIDAVRDHALTDADFAPTELAVELLYLVEAKSAVMEELRGLNLRLEGARSQAEEQALTDTLTGLRNRRAFDLALRSAAASSHPFALVHLDLDFFKAVNDTLGHAAGDHVLREVARVLVEETRGQDTVARVGGDEFVIILHGLDDAKRSRQIVERIIRRLLQPIPYEDQVCRIGASAGIALASQYALRHADTMLNDADQALYSAKRAGRGCVRVHLEPEPEQPGQRAAGL